MFFSKMELNIFLAAMLSVLVQVSGWLETYRGAVVEYHPVTTFSGELNVNANVQNYINFMIKAKAKKTDIIVFPEGSLSPLISSPIPDPTEEIIPCDDKNFQTTKAVKDLSCASKNNSIYSVINLLEQRKCKGDPNCPPLGFYIFNTNVVFDRKGMVIARYAKNNLFDEILTNRPEDPEIVFFDTDFNVRFGTFTCFDILFSTPAQRLVQQYQIKDFVFPTFWFSELPFLTALQVQRGWAETNNVNLLAAGVNFPTSGSSGSGIYNGKFGQIVEIIMDEKASKLLIADIPKIKDTCCSIIGKGEIHTYPKSIPDYYSSNKISVRETQKVEDEPESEIKFLKDQIQLYTSEVISEGIFEQKICSRNDFCCDFSVKMEALKPESANYTYRAMAYNGVRYFGKNFTGGVQSCGVVLCSGPHILNCTNRMKELPGLFKFKAILIKGRFNSKNSFQIPSTLVNGKELKPLDADKYEFTMKRNDLKSEVSLELLWPINDIHTFAIWGRDFTRDMEREIPVAGTSDLVPIPFTFLTMIGFALFIR